MIGQKFGHYRIVEKLGQGGMGVVYLAEDTQLGRRVALKLLPTEKQADETARARLLREARSASALNHPNICIIYEVGEAEGQSYIAMELAEGRPLSALVPAEGLPVETVQRYGAQIADALSHAHERGIVHRDLKSANVVITPEGRGKVLDFGLAKRLVEPNLGEGTVSRTPLTEVGTVAGTLHYMAPEVLRGEPADARSDIWALGVVLYEMASGKLPFEGKTDYELSSVILQEPSAPLPTRVPAVLRSIVARCLAKVPGQRYQRASEVRAALEVLESTEAASVFGQRPVQAEPAAPPAGGRRLSTGGTASGNPEANEYFEKGMAYLAGIYELQRARQMARQMLERALKIDPQFSEARAWYGFLKVLMIIDGLSNDTSWLYEAEDEVRRALADDPNCARAHCVLASIYLFSGRKEMMPGEIEKILHANPKDVDARFWLSTYQRLWGDSAAAEAGLRALMGDAPTFWPARLHFGYLLLAQGDTGGALRAYDKVLEQDSENVFALQAVAQAYMVANDLPQAAAALDRIRPVAPNAQFDYRTRVHRALLLALEGKSPAAQKELDDAVQKFAGLFVWESSPVAEFYAVVGDTEKALEWLDRAVRNGDERGEWFQRDPLLASIRHEPRFKQILESIAFRHQQRAQPATR